MRFTPLTRIATGLLPTPSLLIRAAHASTSSASATGGSASAKRTTIESTTFDAKSAPREVYFRPEAQRGMPAEGSRPTWAKGVNGNGTGAVSAGQASEALGRDRVVAREGDPEGERFAGPSRPRAIYERPGDRELPVISKRWPWLVALAVLGLGWGAFVVHATNAERLASSIMKQVQFQLRHSAEVRALLGEGVQLEPGLLGIMNPWISGSVNMLQGRVDLKFRITGSDGAGTVYFTSIRPQQESTWRIGKPSDQTVRYKVIADNGQTLRLDDKFERAT